MKKSGVLAIATILVGVLFTFSSCEQTTSTELEETFNVIQEVSAISGAQNATMNLQSNRDEATFIVDLSNIEPNNLVNNSNKEGWCIEWDKPANIGTQEGAKLYSTRGKEAWNELNHFLSIKHQLRNQDPDLTYKEFQVVIWSLVPFKPFDVDKIPQYEELGTNYYKDGEYQFDVQKVKDIVSQVKSDANSLQKLKDGTKFEVFAVIVENNGQTIMVEGDETFWAFGTAYCFRGDKGNQWGWAYAFENTDGNSESTPLVAGAGQSVCPDETVKDAGGTIVGEVTLERDGDNLTIILSVTPDTDYVIDVVHIDVDNVLQDLIDRINNNGGNVPPGQFPLSWSDDENGEVATEVTFTVDLVENGLSESENLYFAIHGVSGTVSE